MNLLQWSDALELQQPQMDQTHREFVDLLQRTGLALQEDPAVWLALYDELIEHTIVHFAQEERWMADIGFEPANCHSRQHEAVLRALNEVRESLQSSRDAKVMAQLLAELGHWFAGHAASMDAALRYTVEHAGYDPSTRRCERPLASDSPSRSTCGSSACA